MCFFFKKLQPWEIPKRRMYRSLSTKSFLNIGALSITTLKLASGSSMERPSICLYVKPRESRMPWISNAFYHEVKTGNGNENADVWPLAHSGTTWSWSHIRPLQMKSSDQACHGTSLALLWWRSCRGRYWWYCDSLLHTSPAKNPRPKETESRGIPGILWHTGHMASGWHQALPTEFPCSSLRRELPQPSIRIAWEGCANSVKVSCRSIEMQYLRNYPKFLVLSTHIN